MQGKRIHEAPRWYTAYLAKVWEYSGYREYLDPIRPATGSEGTQWHTVVLTHDGTTSKTQNYLVGRKRPGYSALSFQDVVPGRRERCHRLRHFARWHPLAETFVGCAATDQHRWIPGRGRRTLLLRQRTEREAGRQQGGHLDDGIGHAPTRRLRFYGRG